MSKQAACPNNQRLLDCLSAIALVPSHSWFCCPDLNGPWGFHFSSAPMNAKMGTEGAGLVEILSAPWKYQELSRDLCAAMHGLLW